MPRAAKKSTYADLRDAFAKARAALEKAGRQVQAAASKVDKADRRKAVKTAGANREKVAAAVERCEQLQSEINTIESQIKTFEAAERQQYPQHFQKSDEDKARLLLFGWLDGGLKALTRHWFPTPGSFLEHECLWSLWKVLHGRIERQGSHPKEMRGRIAAVLKAGETRRDFVRLAAEKEFRYREGIAPSDILRQLASLFVPDDDHPLAHPKWVARIGQRRAGKVANVFAVEQIVAAVASFEGEGFGREGAVNEVVERYAVSRERVYQCLRQAPSSPVIPSRRRPRRT